MKRLAILAAAGLALGSCYYAPYGAYPYGGYYGPNVAGAAVLGAGLGALAGAAIVSGPGYYGHGYGYGYGYGPRYYGGYPGYYGWRRW